MFLKHERHPRATFHSASQRDFFVLSLRFLTVNYNRHAGLSHTCAVVILLSAIMDS